MRFKLYKVEHWHDRPPELFEVTVMRECPKSYLHDRPEYNYNRSYIYKWAFGRTWFATPDDALANFVAELDRRQAKIDEARKWIQERVRPLSRVMEGE
jgi:hypothetical protein